MSVSIIQDWDEFQSLGRVWNQVLDESEGFTVQMTHKWLSLYWKYFAGDAEVEILMHEDENGHVIGFTPLMTKRHRRFGGLLNFKQLTFLADDFTDYSDFIVRSRRGAVLVNEVFPFLEQKKDVVDSIHLRHIRTNSPNWGILKRVWGQDFIPVTENLICRLGGSRDDYLATRGRNIRREVKKRYSKLDRDGFSVQVNYFEKLDPSLLLDMVDCSRKRATCSEHTSVLARPQVVEFLTDLSQVPLPCGRLAGWTMRHGSTLVSYRLGFLVSGVFYDWQTDYNLEFAEYSVGKLLLANAIEDCFSKDILIFDFMVGAEPYKQAWANDMSFLYSFRWVSSSFRNRLYTTVKAAKDLVVGFGS